MLKQREREIYINALHRERERDRQTDKERDTERERETERVRDRERNSFFRLFHLIYFIILSRMFFVQK